MSSWQTIYRSSLQHWVEIVKDLLATSDSPALVFDRKNYGYHLGDCEVSVSPDQLLRAVKLVQDKTDLA